MKPGNGIKTARRETTPRKRVEKEKGKGQAADRQSLKRGQFARQGLAQRGSGNGYTPSFMPCFLFFPSCFPILIFLLSYFLTFVLLCLVPSEVVCFTEHVVLHIACCCIAPPLSIPLRAFKLHLFSYFAKRKARRKARKKGKLRCKDGERESAEGNEGTRREKLDGRKDECQRIHRGSGRSERCLLVIILPRQKGRRGPPLFRPFPARVPWLIRKTLVRTRTFVFIVLAYLVPRTLVPA